MGLWEKTLIRTRTCKAFLAPCKVGLAVVASFSLHSTFAQGPQSNEKQKLAEGQYVRLKENLKVEGSEQNWILWRLPDGGFELEDHFQKDPNMAALMLLQMPLYLSSGVSPDLRKELSEIVYQTDLVARFDSGFRPTDLKVTGKKLPRGVLAEAAKCTVQKQIVKCQSSGHDAKLHLEDSAEFFYNFPFPMLFSGWFRGAPASSTVLNTRKLAYFQYVGKAQLSDAEAHVRIQDDEQLTVGDQQFRTHTAQVTITTKNSQPMQFTVWFGKAGQIFATQGAGEGNERVALVQYKKYLDF
jgi:hypothetical protein